MTRTATAAQPTAKRLASTRSAVSNGKLPGGVSACSAAGRRFKDIVEDLTAELGGQLSATEQLQVRMIAGLVLHAEQQQEAVMRGAPVDSEQLVRVSNSAARMMAALRRRAPAKPKRPGLQDYLASKRAEAAA